MTKSTPWKSRIVDHGEVAPDQLLANPKNFRIHPSMQQAALGGSLNTLGWISEVIVNRTTGHLVDGHLRVVMALRNSEPFVPVTYVELTELEESQALLSLDPIAAMASTDAAQLQALLDAVGETATDAQVKEFLKGMQAEADELAEYGGDGTPAGEKSDGSLLDLLSITISNPVHQVNAGDVWTIGNHILVCAQVISQWQLWKPYLDGEDTLFCPYPGPFVPLTLAAEKRALLMVQPDDYVCGHILDRWAEVKGEDTIRRVK